MDIEKTQKPIISEEQISGGQNTGYPCEIQGR